MFPFGPFYLNSGFIKFAHHFIGTNSHSLSRSDQTKIKPEQNYTFGKLLKLLEKKSEIFVPKDQGPGKRE
jgi:hypothetical protein